MQEVLFVLIGTVLVNNFVLSRFLGLCPFFGVSQRLEPAIGMGLATLFVLTLAAVLSWCVSEWVLRPLDVEYLRTIAFIVVIATVVQLTELFMRQFSPVLHSVLGLYLPLITTNCAVLGVALLNGNEGHGLLLSAWYGFGAALGFMLVLVIFTSLRERLAAATVPFALQGAPIALITAGILSLAFMGFAGLDRAL